MKRLLAYLFIVLGFGLTFNVNSYSQSFYFCQAGINSGNWGSSSNLYVSKKQCNKKYYTEISKEMFIFNFLYRDNLLKITDIKLTNTLNTLYSQFDMIGINRTQIHEVINKHRKLERYKSIISTNKKTQIAKKEPSQTQSVKEFTKIVGEGIGSYHFYTYELTSGGKPTKDTEWDLKYAEEQACLEAQKNTYKNAFTKSGVPTSNNINRFLIAAIENEKVLRKDIDIDINEKNLKCNYSAELLVKTSELNKFATRKIPETNKDNDLEEEKRKIAEEKKKIEEEKRKIAEAKKKQEEEEKKRKEEEEDILIVGAGTGFFVNEEGYVITNNHVVEICKIMAAEIEGEPQFFKILATDEQNDLAIVKGDYKNKNFLNLSIRGAVFGEDIVAFGYPLDSELSSSVKLTRGIVSSLSGPKNNIAQIQIDAAIQPGNSGGPVLNYEGQVVGVASSGLNKWYMIEKSEYIPENVNFAVAAPTLLSFLKANNINFSDKKISINKTQELAKIGMPSTIQLLCLNTKSTHEKYKKNKKYSDVLLKQVVELK